MNKTEKIRQLNDQARQSLGLLNQHVRVVMTQGVAYLEDEDRVRILQEVRNFGAPGFAAFVEGDDPYEEHDFGAFDYNETRYYWKIDYFEADTDFNYGADDPANPETTVRVLTIMEASEY